MSRHEPRERRQRQETVTSSFVNDALSGPGQPLPDATREYLAPKFGHSFFNVRVFADEQANKAADALDAKAFTVGENIAFNAGHYDPESAEGQGLLMHELSHTIQQGPLHRFPDQLPVSHRSDPAEQAARAVPINAYGPPGAGLNLGSSAPSVQLQEINEKPVPMPEPTTDPAAQPAQPTPVPSPFATPEQAPAGVNFDPQRLQLSGQTPVGSGTFSAVANPQGVTADLVQDGYRLSTGARGYTSPFLNAAVETNNFQFQGSLTPEQLALQAQMGSFSGDLSYGAGGIDGGLNFNRGPNQVSLRTSGLKASHQGDGWSVGGQADKNGIGVNGSAQTNIFGLPVVGNAKLGVQNEQVAYGAGLTLPSLPFSPSLSVEGQGTQTPNVFLKSTLPFDLF